MAPILAFLSEKGFEEARQAGYDIFEYVIRNGHKIYNPYYSALLHHWTFLPDMDTDKVKPWDRVSNRNKNLKYKVKVKRGANNWYFSGGFRWAFKKFGGECSTFWHCLWYKPFIFLADRVYHPYIYKWFGIKVKNNSYYCLGSTNENHGTVLDLIRGWLSSLISLWKDRSYLCLILSSCKKPNALKEINSGPI